MKIPITCMKIGKVRCCVYILVKTEKAFKKLKQIDAGPLIKFTTKLI